MQLALYSRPGIEYDPCEVRTLLAAAADNGFQVKINRSFAEALEHNGDIVVEHNYRYDEYEWSGTADFAVSYGGDGTFIDCVKLLGLRGLPILGINSGRLGFLANIPKESVCSAMKCLREGRYRKVRRIMLDVLGGQIRHQGLSCAFNEFTIQRAGAGMISVEVYVDDEMVGNYWGDGVMISTPAGSTAYSLSVGGPVIAPGCGCFVISPIAPHNLTMRPLVIPDGSKVDFRLSSRDGAARATLDGASFEAEHGSRFTITRSEKTVFLIELQNISFYDTLRNKMMWGFDRRDNTLR